ncbi:GTPase activating protein [Sporothrix brasiliensis 5110]|uniref:GTPase activating protein n=1 Tax=Sporothrix brasiliensis 5110 TaxID=1398154 RepID=A0A0C2ICA5_9PEZI|nr:GTPase activating protein [Sporothrix brasiliensis 5110]KIH86931.1 GTPase activating protein [Sporothrix brasiliensis 5110]
MLRRIVSLGQQVSEGEDDFMSPPSNDAGRPSESKVPGGLAGVFKGLTGPKLTKAPALSSSPSAAATSISPLPLTAPVAAATLSSSSITSAQSTSEPTDADSLNSRSGVNLTSYADCLELLKTGTPSERVAAANALRSIITESPVQSMTDVWHAANDLIDPGKAQVARHAGWELLLACARLTSSTSIERREYFQAIAAPADPSDFHLQLSALVELTSNGRSLSGFDYDVFPVLTEWFQTAYKSKAAAKKPPSTRSTNGKSGKVKGVQTAEERNLSQLFAYAIDVIKYSAKIASDRAMEGLLDSILDIAMNTSTEDDLSSCIAIINTCVTVGAMPSKSLERCVKVLSSIYCLVPKLRKTAWQVLANIFKSHHGLHTITILLEALRKYPLEGVEVKDATRELRGALAVLQKLVRKAGSTEYPTLPFTLLVDGLENVVSHTPSPRIVASILQLINQLFDAGDGDLNPLLLDEDWAALLGVATICAKRSNPSATYDGTANTKQSLGAATGPEEPSQDAVDREAAVLTARVEALLRGLNNERPEYMQRNCCVSFLADVHHILPDSGAELVLKYFAEFSCCFPSDPQWDSNLKLVLGPFYANQSRSAAVRLLALQTAIDVHNVLSLVDEVAGSRETVADLVRRILAHIGEERDTVLLFHAISFAVTTSPYVDDALFRSIVEAFGSVIKSDERRQPLNMVSSGSTPVSPLMTSGEHTGVMVDQSTSNIATRGLIRIFMDTMNTDAGKASLVFKELVGIARDKSCPVDARLSALKLLFRLRADWAHRIFLVSNTESEGLAAVLLRTEASLERKMADEVTQEILARQARNEPGAPLPAGSQHPTRVTRGVSFGQGGGPQDRVGAPHRTASSTRQRASAPRYTQQWSLPDPDALPQAPIATASTVLFSHELEATVAGMGVKDKGKVPKNSHDAAAADGETSVAPNVHENESNSDATPAKLVLDMTAWMEVVFDILTQGANWELYSYALVHLPSQLSNHAVCRAAVPVILRIRTALCDQIQSNNSQEPPAATGLRRPDAQTCVLQTLTMILSYHEYFQRQEGDDLVRTFIAGLTDKNPISCVHALSICCYELPHATSKSLVSILHKMSQIITRPGVAVHILELLACLSRLPWLYSNFREDEYRIAFGVCFRYLQAVRDRRKSARVSHSSASDQNSVSAYNGYGLGAFDSHGPEVPSQTLPLQPNASDDLPQYVYALAYHVLTFWFLALRVTDRAKYVTWIASRLFVDNDGSQVTDEQAQITLDFMQRVAFSDADESAPADDPDVGSGQEAAVPRSWVMGNSILTIQLAASKAGLARITKRQPSGTSYYTIQENLQPRPPHQTRGLIDPMVNISSQAHHSQPPNPVLPSHLLAQLLAPVPQQFDSPLRPIPLPNDDVVERAFRAFDRNSTVDGHKVGVIYIGEGQTDEAEILANVSGSSDYVDFLNGLGTLVRLKGATFNTQGLDREFDTDGAYTFCWRDRVTEIVFHVTTQMPTDRERDPICISKKRHIGNDFVNIIFNDSGLPFRFDTFPSEFNYVNIVITPESRASFVARRELSLQKQREDENEALAQEQQQQQQQQGDDSQQKQQQQPSPRQKRAMPFYKVQVMSKPGFPEISPAARTKIISLKALPDFIRLLALNASVFSQVWSTRQGGEHISSWRNRLRQIHRLRERYGPSALAAVAPSPPPSSMGGGDASGPSGGAGGAAGAGASGPGAAGGAVGSGAPGAGSAVGASNSSLASGVGASAGTGTSNTIGGSGPSLTGGNSSAEQLSRTSVSGMRDSFNSLRRTSMATFFTVAGGDPNNQRSSVHSTATATTASENTDSTAVNGGSSEVWVDSLDFSKWT